MRADVKRFNEDNVLFWVIVVCWTLMWLCIWFVFHSMPAFPNLVIGAVAGFMIGWLLTTAFLVSNLFLWWTLVFVPIMGVTILSCLGSYKKYKNVSVLLISFIGSYSFMRGISHFISNTYPSETELQRELSHKITTWDNFPKTFYVYMAAILLLTALSFYFQRWSNSHKEAHIEEAVDDQDKPKVKLINSIND